MQAKPPISTKIEVRLFAAAADIVGTSSLSVELCPGDSLADLAGKITAAHPELAPLLAASRWAINREFAAQPRTIFPQDELAIIPPVSGG